MKRTSLSHSQKLAILCLALLLSAVAATLSTPDVASAATTTAQWKLWQLDRDGCWDATTIDANFNGYWETALFDLDNDCRWDTRIWNSLGGDHFAESQTFDMNENGVPEYQLLDINQRVGFEWAYFDLNEDRRFEQRRIIPGSDLDYATRTNTNNVNSATLHMFTMATGQSLLYPSFRTP